MLTAPNCVFVVLISVSVELALFVVVVVYQSRWNYDIKFTKNKYGKTIFLLNYVRFASISNRFSLKTNCHFDLSINCVNDC